MPDAQPKRWAEWCPESQTLTVSRPPELTHDQLQAIWSPFIADRMDDQTLSAINEQIESAVRAAHKRRDEETREQRRREEEAARRREEERQRADRERREAEEKRRREEQESKERAEALLMRHLTEQQREDLRTKNHFFVEVRGERYRISRGRSGNVQQLDKDGQAIRQFCIHPREYIPDADTMLAQKLFLETDPDGFHRIANVTNLTPANRRAA